MPNLERTSTSAHIDGAPARNQNAIMASKIMHPKDDVGMKGQIGLPRRWCAMSQQECISQASTTLLDPQMEIPEFHHGFQVPRSRDEEVRGEHFGDDRAGDRQRG
jgi:hypothetical protein